MAVRIRLKKMGRRHLPFYRVCAIDRRTPRDGRVLEELGTYDTSIADTDARAVLKKDRVDYWLGVGAQPSDKVAVLIKKYGTNGSHVEKQEAALLTLAEPRKVPDPGAPASMPKIPEEPKKPTEEAKADAPAAAAEETKVEETKAVAVDDAPVPEQPAPETAEEAATESKETEEASTEETSTEEVKEEASAAE